MNISINYSNSKNSNKSNENSAMRYKKYWDAYIKYVIASTCM